MSDIRPVIGQTPDGHVTTDAEYYVRTWREFAQPILDMCPDLKLLGYDPGLMFTRTSLTHHEAWGDFSLPTWFVKHINEGIRKLRETR